MAASPAPLAEPAAFSCLRLYVVGVLYGNDIAFGAILDRARAETTVPVIVFNGDFHYLDTDDPAFAAVHRGVRTHHAIRGNIEAQLVESDPTAGCDYPEYIHDTTLERSNSILPPLFAFRP